MTTAVDASGNGHDGTYFGLPANAAGLVVGDSDTAIAFDPATNDYLAQDDAIPAQTFTALTLGCIVKPANPTDPHQPTIVGLVDSSFVIYANIWLDSSAFVNFSVNAGEGNAGLTSTTQLSVGQVCRIIAVLDGANVTLWVNGVAEATAAYTTFTTTEDIPFYVGADQVDNFGNVEFNGTIDEAFFIANHAATPTEVASIDDAWNGIGPLSPLGAVNALSPYLFYRLDDLDEPSTGTFRFTPPTEQTVSNVAFDALPIANALRRYYPIGPRGKAVWHLEDDTITFDQPYPTVFPDAAQHSDLFPVPPASNWWGSNLTAVTAKVVYYGGHTYIVDTDEEVLLAAFLTAQGYTPGDWLVPL